MALLTTFIMPLAILTSMKTIHERTRLYYILMLMEWAMIGVFVAQDLPCFTCSGSHPGADVLPDRDLGRRGTDLRDQVLPVHDGGHLLMLLAILWLATGRDVHRAGIIEKVNSGELSLSTATGRWLFLAFGIAFAIKVPMWPLHSWLPDAHVATTAGP